MADYTEARSKTATLVGDQEDTFTLTLPFRFVEVTNVDGASRVAFTVNGAAATVDGDDCYVLPAAVSSRKVFVNSTRPVVRVISAGTPVVHVEGLSS